MFPNFTENKHHLNICIFKMFLLFHLVQRVKKETFHVKKFIAQFMYFKRLKEYLVRDLEQ